MTTFDYDIFELFVGVRNERGYPLSVLTSPAGEVSSLCAFDPQNYELLDSISALSEYQLDDEETKQVGTFLFDELFTGEIGELYRASQTVARTQGKGLQIRIRIEAVELAALPWEFLFDNKEDSFLATAANTTLTRYVPLRLPIRPLKIALPLRILVAVASPSDLDALDVQKEVEMIQQALADLLHKGQVEYQVVEQATLTTLNQSLRQWQPHVFHYVGHSKFEGEHAFVALEDDRGQSNWVDESSFRELFATARETRLAVLNACQSATLSASRAQAGLAPNLLQRQLSAVVAMQFPIIDETSLIFSREFYRSLALGYPVDVAMTEARRSILLEVGLENRPDFGVPVLFLRAKDGQLFELEPAEQKAVPTIPPPPEPLRPPSIKDFVGRQQELDKYRQTLEQRGRVAIAGMPGVGKTALAATLALNSGPVEKIFWHTCYQGENALGLVWKLAAFLAWNKRNDLWNLLQNAQLSGGQPPPANILIDYALQMMKGQGYLLCLDDFHLLYDNAQDDPHLNQLIEHLAPALAAGEVRLIVATRSSPRILDLFQDAPLPGLSPQDTQQLLAAREIKLSAELLDQLYLRTEGNAELLTLALQSLRRSQEASRVISRLVESEDIESYLLGEVDKSLSDEEKLVMNGVAVLLGQLGTRDAIEFTLDQGSIRRNLTYLTNRYLLTVHDVDPERTYGQHAIVRDFYYDLIGIKDRQTLHARAAEYYELHADEPLLAAQHYLRAGNPQQAAHLATTDMVTVINRGQTALLQQLLVAIEPRKLDPLLQAELQIAQAEIHHYFRRSDAARQHYSAALTLLEGQPDLALVRQQRAHIHRRMGELLLHGSPAEGLDWVERGLALLTEQDKHQEASLLIQRGALQNILGNADEALLSLQKGLALTPATVPQQRADALINLGAVYGTLGDTAKAIDASQQALKLCEQLHDPYRRMKISTNLGLDLYDSGDPEGGIATLREALKLAEELGSVLGQAQAAANLGDLLLEERQLKEAEAILTRGVELARRGEEQRVEVVGLINLARVHLEQHSIDTAVNYIEISAKLADYHEILDLLEEIRLIKGQCAVELSKATI